MSQCYSALQVCTALNCQLIAPPPKYCTDNGVMIAWNGLEKYRVSSDIVPHDKVLAYDGGFRDGISPREPFGIDISNDVERSQIKCKWIKVK